MTEIVVGEDGVPLCPWATSAPEYRDYHDREWGRPVGDDRQIFEKLCLEGFQAGLSWLTILRKRDSFRQVFAGFDPAAIAAFGSGDIDRLLADSGIVRNRSKIEATIHNARAVLRLEQQGISIAAVLWRHEPVGRDGPELLGDILPSTPESKALSAELRKLGFRFVGPTTVYAAMQSLGVVNDHLTGCHCRPVVEKERANFSRPA